MSETQETSQLTLKLSIDEITQIENIAKDRQCSVDEAVRYILEYFLTKIEEVPLTESTDVGGKDSVKVIVGSEAPVANTIEGPGSRVGQDQFEPNSPSPASMNSDGSIPIQKSPYHDSTGKPIVINQLEADPSALPDKAMRQLEEIRKKQAERARSVVKKKPTASGKFI